MAKKSELSIVEMVRELKNRKPFRPFRIVMKSGERHEIVYPRRS